MLIIDGCWRVGIAVIASKEPGFWLDMQAFPGSHTSKNKGGQT